MARGSKRYTELNRRLRDLNRHLLAFIPPPPQSRTSYTPEELDLTRSYIVLAHAEIEAFCEDLALGKATFAKQAFDSQGIVSPVLRRIIAYYIGKHGKSWSEVTTPSAQTIASALQSYIDAVHNNHGVKRENLEKLLYPLGVQEPKLDATWLAQMDSFGRNRGAWAHQSIRATNPPDPASELTNVNQLLQGLLLLDRLLGRLV
jgi:hypothetical protein